MSLEGVGDFEEATMVGGDREMSMLGFAVKCRVQ